jgi:hypothetical protein
VSHPIDVGSVLGGRYKVTATVLTSHDQDLVLDGVDQVLNRDVSILVAGPANADQVAQSAREVATGERPGQMQILDLGVSESTTYLITNHASAADLLDLVVASNPPYVEPFFTDTLGSEIFGQARSQEPETYDGLYDDEEVDAGYINYGQNQPQQPGQQAAAPPVPPSRVPSRAPAAEAGPPAAAAGGVAAAGTAAPPGPGAGAAAPASPDTAPQETAPQPTAPQPLQDGAAYPPARPAAAPLSPPPAEEPKVSLWSGEDYDYDDAAQPAPPAREEQAAEPYAAQATAGTGRSSRDRAPDKFPASARNHDSADDDDYFEKDDEPRREPRSARWLVGGLLAAVLVVGMVFAVANLGSLFKSSPPPAADGTSPSSTPGQSSGPPAGTASPAPVSGPPAIEGVTRLGNFDFAATYDGDLGKTFDGNGASYWSDMEFASDNWGGFATEVPLVIKLKSPSKVSSVTLSQLGGSGGNISVFTNDRPALEGAKQVGVNSFTSPDLTMPLAEPVTAQYVIVSIKALPKLAAPKTRYGYGLRLAEVKVQ